MAKIANITDFEEHVLPQTIEIFVKEISNYLLQTLKSTQEYPCIFTYTLNYKQNGTCVIKLKNNYKHVVFENYAKQIINYTKFHERILTNYPYITIHRQDTHAS